MDAIRKIVNKKLREHNILDTGVSIAVASELGAFFESAMQEVSIIAQTATPIYANSNGCLSAENSVDKAVELLDAALNKVDVLMSERIDKGGSRIVN